MASRRRKRGDAKAKYEAYIVSDAWRALRERYRRERPWACAVCGKTKGLHLHHRTYLRLGREELDDLVPLCKEHHEAVHASPLTRDELWDAHSRVTHETTVIVLPPAGHPPRPKTKRPKKKYKPRKKFFIKSQEKIECRKCSIIFPAGWPQLRCNYCGEVLRYARQGKA